MTSTSSHSRLSSIVHRKMGSGLKGPNWDERRWCRRKERCLAPPKESMLSAIDEVLKTSRGDRGLEAYALLRVRTGKRGNPPSGEIVCRKASPNDNGRNSLLAYGTLDR